MRETEMAVRDIHTIIDDGKEHAGGSIVSFIPQVVDGARYSFYPELVFD